MLRIDKIYFQRSKLGFLLLSSLILFSCTNTQQDKLVIAAAANAQFAIEKIAVSFEQKTGISTEVIISSSGKHTAQIEAGAPYDVFISADAQYPMRLYNLGYTVEPPKIYAYGKLILWVNTETLSQNITEILTDNIDHIAMPNPKTAPYGIAAFATLENLGLAEILDSKLVYGESVAQTNQYILSGAVDLGFTSESTVHSPLFKAEGKWIVVPQELYAPLAQAAVVIKRAQSLEQAEKFYNYLFGIEAQQTLEEFGYLTTLVQ